MGLAKEFPIEKMDGFRIGNAQNEEAGTGVTVVLFDKDKGARAGVDVSGGGPASRETPLASPLTADNPVNAIVLSGGSAYGLASSDGVMHWLEEHGFGFDTGYARVPLVCQSCMSWKSRISAAFLLIQIAPCKRRTPVPFRFFWSCYIMPLSVLQGVWRKNR